jgi:undecaprenyl-diphosphatase
MTTDMYKSDSVQVRVWRLDRLDAWEAALMRPLLLKARSRARGVALAVNHLGNGWLFAAVGLAALLFGGASGWRFARLVTTALVVAFSVYLVLKRFIARVRPCHADPTLDARVRPLDLYSCPSGHAMTAAIFAVALTGFSLAAAAAAIPMLALIAWSRVSLGHHYPSDVILGACMGGAVALPLTLWVR